MINYFWVKRFSKFGIKEITRMVTIKDIAKEAQVSITTVSFILNGKYDQASEETVQRVLSIAKKYNYSPNPIAVGLVTKKTKTIGLVIPDIQNVFFGEVAKHVDNEVTRYGYNVILCNTNGNIEEDIKYIDILRRRGIDGLIISPSGGLNETKLQEKMIDTLNKIKIPFVCLDRWSEGLTSSRVSIDHCQGGYLATKYLIEQGHRKIGCLTGPLNVHNARRRLNGYQKALSEFKIPYNQQIVFEGDYRFESGYSKGQKILNNDITAIFISNDLMCYGFYKAVRELNKKIPDDISVIGFDDLFFSNMLDVPLTTIRQPVETIAVTAAQILLEQIKGNQTYKNIKFQPELIIRKSVRKVGD